MIHKLHITHLEYLIHAPKNNTTPDPYLLSSFNVLHENTLLQAHPSFIRSLREMHITIS